MLLKGMDYVMSKQEYLIGDVASMMGVSRDTLRFYEKKGILAVRKKENGYRYYTDEDIFELSSIFYHRKMNMGLDEIESLRTSDSSYQSNAIFADQKIREEEEKILKHQQTLVRLHLFRDECRKIERHLNRFSIKDFPDAYVIGTCASLQEGLRQWFYLSQKTPGLDMAYTYDFYDYCKNGDKTSLEFKHSSLLFYKELIRDLRLSLDFGSCPSAQKSRCLYTIVESDSRTPGTELADAMMDWGEQQGLQPKRLLVSDYIMHGTRDGQFTYYLELYIPLSR